MSILAQAWVVEVGAFEVEDPRDQAFKIGVVGWLEQGGEPLGERTYDIEAEDASIAAFAGINLYVEEMQRVN